MSSITIFLVLLVVIGIIDATVLLSSKQKLSLAQNDKIIPLYMKELYIWSMEASPAEKLLFNSVQCFLEKAVEDPSPNLYTFSDSSLKQLNTSTIQRAELHLYKKNLSVPVLHSSTMPLSLFEIRVYQVQPNRSLDEPHLHYLLTVKYVNADFSGWQIFDVTVAVQSWLHSSPNLGLLVTTSLDNQQIQIDYVRRNQEPRDKQPILAVISGDDTGMVILYKQINPMKIYERAMRREESKVDEDKVNKRPSSGESYFSTTGVDTVKSNQEEEVGSLYQALDAEPCKRLNYFVNFEELYMDFIIAPVRYNAYQCRGQCLGHCKRLPKEFKTNFDKIETVSVTVSVGTLVYISFDRWYAIRSPLKFKSTTSRAKKVIFIIWMLALTIDIPELIAYRTFSLIPSPEVREKTNLFTQCGPDWEISTQLYVAWVKFVGLYVVPLMLISFAYLQIARVLWSGEIPGHNLSARIVNSNQLSSQASMGNTECQLKSRRKAAKMLLAVVLVFAICCLPVHFFSIYRFSTPVKATPLANIISCLVHWLFYANSAINPLIYNFMSGKFRKEFKRTFANCCSPTGSSHNRSVYRVAGNVSKNLQSVRSTSCNNSMHTRFALTIFSNNNNTSNNNLRHSTEIVPLSGICNSPNGMQQQSVGNHSVVTYQ